jgi:ATP-binding cassette, subfamily C, bacterial CydC
VDRRLLRIAQPALGWMALAAALGVLTVGSGVALMAASAWVISAAALQPSIAELQVAIVALRLFGITRGLLRYAERLASHHATFQLLARLRLWFFTSLEPLAPARLQQFQSGDLLTRILSDIETLQDFYLRAISPPVVGLVVALLTAWVLAGISPALAALNVCLVCLGGIGLAWVAQRLTRSSGARLIQARSEMQAALVEALQGMGDWLAYGLEAGWITRLGVLGSQQERSQSRRSDVLGLVSSASSALGMLACLATIAVLTPQIHLGGLPGVWLAAFALGVLASYEPVGALPSAAEQASRSRQAAARLLQVVETAPEVDEAAGSPFEAPFRSLRLEQLSFHYPHDPRPVLSDVTFNLARGQRLAVLGSSGSGKSTLIHLLLRFWEADSGRILVNDVDILQLEAASVRRLFSSLLQPPYVFSDTLASNVGLQQPDLQPRAIEHALELAELTLRVQTMPDGLDTWVGDFGTALSSGERQRLALARALARPAPILLLDEPTAGLDPITAGRVLDNIWGALDERTLIVVTHDPTALERMDEILILERGTIAARGTHAELASRDNLYRRMLAARRQEVILERLQRQPEQG